MLLLANGRERVTASCWLRRHGLRRKHRPAIGKPEDRIIAATASSRGTSGEAG